MLGNPKYKEGDKVYFKLSGSNTIYMGNIAIVDRYGTFENNTDVSYDIIVNNDPDYFPEKVLYKHITESLIMNSI